MNEATAKPQAPPAHVRIFELLSGVFAAGAVTCLARLGVPDLVEKGPKSAEELASLIGAQPDALYRLMRATASVGVLSEGADGKFSETPMSAVLRSNGTPSLRGFAIMTGTEWHARGWAHLEYCVRTGCQAPENIFGAPMFQFLEQNPEQGKIFNQAMSDLSAIDSPAVADAYNFGEIRSIVDVGGGEGGLLRDILAATPELRGILFDLPQVVAGAPAILSGDVAARCQIVGGSFFDFVPEGGNAYLMKGVIHDWPDDDAVKILQNIRRVIPPGGTLLLVESLVDSKARPAGLADMLMLAIGGRERTEADFRSLLASTRFSLTRIIADRSVGAAFFGDYHLMDYELMGGDAREAVIDADKKRNIPVNLPPQVPFGSHQWPTLITPGPGAKSLADLP